MVGAMGNWYAVAEKNELDQDRKIEGSRGD